MSPILSDPQRPLVGGLYFVILIVFKLKFNYYNTLYSWYIINVQFLQDVQKKAQAIQKQNTTPHVLSRGGYEYLEKKMMDEKTKKKLE